MHILSLVWTDLQTDSIVSQQHTTFNPATDPRCDEPVTAFVTTASSGRAFEINDGM